MNSICTAVIFLLQKIPKHQATTQQKSVKIEIFFNYFTLIGVVCLDFLKRERFLLFWS